MSNGFHCHVTEDITPIEKQDLEYRFWELSNGGKIQYVKYPISYNKEAIRTLVRRAMKMGFYEGVNLSLAYCDDCGHEELEMDVCPVCGSRNLTKIDRMNGYLSYSRVKGGNAASSEEKPASSSNFFRYALCPARILAAFFSVVSMLYTSSKRHFSPGFTVLQIR